MTLAISGENVAKGMPLISTLPEPFLTIARAMAVFLFPVISMMRFFSALSGFSGFTIFSVVSIVSLI